MNVTTTGLRTLIETSASTSVQTGCFQMLSFLNAFYFICQTHSGHISTAERESIRVINGHSSAVVENFYRMHNSARDTDRSSNSFDRLQTPDFRQRRREHFSADKFQELLASSGSTESFLESPISSMALDFRALESQQLGDDTPDTQPPALRITSTSSSSSSSYSENGFLCASNQLAEWGTSHPDFHKSYVTRTGQARKRAKWTDAEKDYIRWCAEKIISEKPNSFKLIKSKIRKTILEDPDARSIFHVNHISVDGIAHGYYCVYGEA